MRQALEHDGVARDLTPGGRRTLEALMDAGRDLFVARGYHDTRINDVVAAAGLSKGAFYRYFESKDRLVQVLGVQAIRTVSTALADIPAARRPTARPPRRPSAGGCGGTTPRRPARRR